MIEAVEMIIRQPGHPDRVVRLQEGATRLGRAEDNDIVLSDVGVSRRHTKIVVTREAVRVEDLGSGNGTYHRGRRVESATLVDGDEIVVDPFSLIFRVKGSAAAADETSPFMARLDVIQGAGLSASSFPIGDRGVTMGRSETRDVVIPDPASSRHHCTIFLQDGRFFLRDMGSANGIYVNGARIRETALADGDRIRIGNTELRFVIGDSTKVAGSGGSATPTGVGWNDEIPAPRPPPALEIDGPDREPSSTMYRASPMASLLPMAAGGLFAMLVLFLVVVVVVAAVWFVKLRNASTTRPVEPPRWALELPPNQPSAPVTEITDAGIKSMRAGDSKTALAQFYRALLTDPGNASVERLAYVAGEFVVLDAMEPGLAPRVEERKKREARRDELLRDAKRKAPARRELEEQWRDDPKVREEMGWGLSEVEQKLQVRLAEAQEHVASRRLKEAIAAFDEVLSKSHDPTLVRTARSGRTLAERELARAVTVPWRKGVTAEARKDVVEARKQFQDVLAADPSNASARVHLARLGKGE